MIRWAGIFFLPCCEIWSQKNFCLLGWILKSVSLSVLINGSPRGFFFFPPPPPSFSYSGVVGQGDPLSFLFFFFFCIAEEVLGRGISELCKSGKEKSISDPCGYSFNSCIICGWCSFVLQGDHRSVINLKEFMIMGLL